MPIKIVRNDITRMTTEAIVNTANKYPMAGSGCDSAIYMAAGYDELLKYRKEKIGVVPEGEVFITPGFALTAKYIIHAVSPTYVDGGRDEEKKMRSCYRKSLKLANKYGVASISFPLISTGSLGYPREEAMRIAVDEINSFIMKNDMAVYLVVFDHESTELGEKISGGLEAYIDAVYVGEQSYKEYGMNPTRGTVIGCPDGHTGAIQTARLDEPEMSARVNQSMKAAVSSDICEVFEEAHEERLEERMKHISDTFSEYLLFLISNKNMTNSEVWKRAIVDKKVFSKIKNNRGYHPQKLTALCLCVGARLNLDETRDLLARAGYALSPCDKTDIIFSYFIENGIYDMIELDIQLEEHGLPCIIS